MARIDNSSMIHYSLEDDPADSGTYRLKVRDTGAGGVSGGGFATYTFTPTNSFGDGTTAYASATTFTVSGHSFTPEATALVKVDRFASTGVFAETLSPTLNTITCSTTSGVTTYTYASGAFASGDLFVVYQGGPERTVSKSTDSQRTEEINPINQQYVEADWLNTTNVASAATGNYYPSTAGIMIGSGKSWAVQHGLNNVDYVATLTYQATLENDSTPAWVDISQSGLDLTTRTYSNASWVATSGAISGIVLFENMPVKYFRAKLVTSGATNTYMLGFKLISL